MIERETRKYQSIETSSRVFDEFLVKMRRRGELMLPSERELSELIGCSRGALRALLDVKLKDGAILKKGKSRSLSMETAARRKVLGSLGFIAMGNTAPGNPAWNKLWCRLSQQAESMDIALELALIPFDLDSFDRETAFNGLPELLVVTTIDKGCRELLLRLPGKTLISTESHCAEEFENVVALDNYLAGKKAASMLASHGYKRPAMICDSLLSEGRPYVQFIERMKGFSDACRELSLDYRPSSLFMVEGQGARLKIEIAKKAIQIAKGSFDSIFLHTDNDLEFLMEGLNSEGKRVPEDVGVVTLNSFDHAVSYNPAVSSVAHGTEQMASTILEKARLFFEQGKRSLGKTYVEPGIHEGKTLK